jgi:electron transfer flavoprotein alpha subunit
MNTTKREIWVFGDYRNYFQNRVTLQLLAKANSLALSINAEVCAILFGHGLDDFVAEYIAHGAQKIYVVEHKSLENYSDQTYARLMEKLAKDYQPEIILVGATSFGKEFAPRVAKRLGTGLTADCIGLEITEDGHLLQIAPAFGGNLVAEIITPNHRPQLATVRPGTFQEIPHDYERRGEVLRIPIIENLPENRVRLIDFKHLKSFSIWQILWGARSAEPVLWYMPAGLNQTHLSARPANTLSPKSSFHSASAAQFNIRLPPMKPTLSLPLTKIPMRR